MPRPRAPRRTTFAACALVLAPPTALHAQLAGSARVALDGGTARLDGGDFNNYALSAGASPFVGEHVQLGLAPGFRATNAANGPRFRGENLEVTANYVIGGGGRWRGYAGGAVARTWQNVSAYTGNGFSAPASALNFNEYGGQAGALYFLTPALALRAEVQYRRPTPVPGARGSLGTFIRLDPYLFGRADEGAPSSAGLGVVDVDGVVSRYDPLTYGYHYWNARLLAAPYLTPWAQLGVDATGSKDSYTEGRSTVTARGFGRLYLPLTVRTQPFAEGAAQTARYSTGGVSLTEYSGALGVRRMLNASVALDVGVRRRLSPRQTFDNGASYRGPGQTGLVLGLATRVGRAR